MKTIKKLRRTGARQVRTVGRAQSGTAMVIAIMVMALLAIFVAASLSRITNEALMMGNDQAETDSYFAAQASLEHVSRNFSDIFDVRITPTTTDITNIQNDLPTGYTNFNITQVLARENPGAPPEQTTVDSGSPFAGLIALREGWRIDSTAESKTGGGEVRLTRTLNNYTIPIFQFGIFYDDPMEHHPGPAFAFGGRVHSNGDIYLMAGNNSTKFRDRVTAHGEVVTDVARNGWSWTHWGNHVYVKDGSTFQLVSEGSVIGGPRTPERIAETPNPVTGVPPYNDTDVPAGTRNANWSTFSARFRGNLTARVSALKLPLQLGGSLPIEIIKRGLGTDDAILRDSRYYNKPCVRVTLSDTQAKLPGGTGGVQLTGVIQPIAGNTVGGGAPGYWPTARPGGAPRATKVNGYRLQPVAGRQVWIKVETVNIDSGLNPVATDVTEAFLSLGMTQQSTIGTNNVAMGDADAIIKIQRFGIAGPPLKVTDAAYFQSANSNAVAYTVTTDRAAQRTVGMRRNVYTFIPGASAAGGMNVVNRDNVYINGNEAQFQYPTSGTDPQMIIYPGVASGNPTPSATVQSTKLVPIPIMMFDTREGLYNDDLTNTGTTSWTSLYKGVGSQRVPVNGVMGLIDFDVANFRRLVTGALDGTIANGLRGSDIPDNGGVGWIVYFSDRRNDRDDDGQYDMENVYVTNASDTTGFTVGEDVNHNNALDVSYDNTGTGLGEGATYNKSDEADVLAVMDTPYFRRAQRLVNGQLLPGNQFKGFSFASENGVYIQGNYNASGVAVGMSGSGDPTPYDQYINASGTMVPASVVADAVTILSNQWNDGKSFRWAFEFGTTALGGRVSGGDDTVRCALLMGDTLSFDQNNGPTQGGDIHLAGGVHNFKRFRETWGNNVNYCGSLINLFNSVGNNGTFKCCTHVYTPPTRNWVFDSNFLDPRRLPPGTPYFQYINLTGFRRTYRQDT